MGALRKDIMPKIMSMHALAPVAYMSHLKSPFLRAIAPFVFSIDVSSFHLCDKSHLSLISKIFSG